MALYKKDDEAKGKSKLIGLAVVAAIWLIEMLVSVGLGAVVPLFVMAAVGAFVFLAVKKKAEANGENAPEREPIPAQMMESLPEGLKNMVSSSEQRHLETGNTLSHDEYAHHAAELRDLLAAGIIDSAEYHDRLKNIKDGI